MRFRLLQARLPDDIVIHEERRSFADRLRVPVEDVEIFDLLTGEATAARVMDGVDAVLVGGSGAFSVNGDAPWLRSFFDTLVGLADVGFPTLASCFGFQGFVVALGCEVAHVEERGEVGTFDLELCPDGQADPLFSNLPGRFRAQLGHQESALSLPAGTTWLARSERCPYQAMRVGDGPVWACQFHPELTGDENRQRFQRYIEMYLDVMGESGTRSVLESFGPSPYTNDILRLFAELIS